MESNKMGTHNIATSCTTIASDLERAVQCLRKAAEFSKAGKYAEATASAKTAQEITTSASKQCATICTEKH